MATDGESTRVRKRKRSEQREGLRRDAKQRSNPLKCPICDVSLRPESLPQHYQKELDKLERLQPCSTHRRREPRPSTSSSMAEAGLEDGGSVLAEAKKTLESVQRRRFLFEHKSHDQPDPTPQSHDSRDMCPVCGVELPSDEDSKAAHIDGCLREQQAQVGGAGGGASDSDSETYEEYTWCNTTRIRTTSLLSPQTRASMFNASVIKHPQEGDASFEETVDVEEDVSALYGPPQFCDDDLAAVSQEEEGEEEASVEKSKRALNGESSAKSSTSSRNVEKKIQPQCLICMDSCYDNPLVSVQCWHVFCEKCWLKALAAQKLCPKCKTITCSGDLRRIFL